MMIRDDHEDDNEDDFKDEVSTSVCNEMMMVAVWCGGVLYR